MALLFTGLLLLLFLNTTSLARAAAAASQPSPTPWPPQFHAVLWMNYSGSLSLIDLWYDWPNGRNFNIIRDQLADGGPLYDLEWNNGTSFFYNLDRPSCSSAQLDVGILRPNWLVDGSVYLGRHSIDGFLCDVWEKLDFIWYYEDVQTKRPVHWVFYTGRQAHVMTYEVGAALNDEKWQAPEYCFTNNIDDDKTNKITCENLEAFDVLREKAMLQSSFLGRLANSH